MNIIDAIKSGKRYKRKAYREWYRPASPTSTCYSSLQYSDEDILADDWEVEPTPIVITREQFEATWYRARTRAADWDKVYKILVEELGL